MFTNVPRPILVIAASKWVMRQKLTWRLWGFLLNAQSRQVSVRMMICTFNTWNLRTWLRRVWREVNFSRFQNNFPNSKKRPFDNLKLIRDNSWVVERFEVKLVWKVSRFYAESSLFKWTWLVFLTKVVLLCLDKHVSSSSQPPPVSKPKINSDLFDSNSGDEDNDDLFAVPAKKETVKPARQPDAPPK